MIDTSQSLLKFKHASSFLTGGVSSPVRAFLSVGGTPLFFKKAKGPYLYDVDDNRYIDFCQSWGALILGHAHPAIVRAIQQQVRKGTSYGACTPLETELAKRLCALFPNCEKFRFTNSGTEAVMTAIRIARGSTGKSRIIKFEGCYHGHLDSLLVKGGSGLATMCRATSQGIPKHLIQDTIVLPYNDTEALVHTFKTQKDIAGVIIEPMAGNMGFIPATPRFLKTIRALTKKTNACLIFDEVITGLRVGLGGAQALYGIKPDLTTLGKVIGGGLPVGAVGGRTSLMKKLAPLGPVYQAGTLSGNPLCMTAGIETLKILSSNNFFKHLTNRCSRFVNKMHEAFKNTGVPVSIPQRGTVFSIFFSQKAPSNFKEIQETHPTIYKRFFHHMLQSGIYIPPSPNEAFFISSAHKARDFDRVIQTIQRFTHHSKKSTHAYKRIRF